MSGKEVFSVLASAGITIVAIGLISKKELQQGWRISLVIVAVLSILAVIFTILGASKMAIGLK